MSEVIDFDFYRRFKVALPARPSAIARALRVEKERRALWLQSYRQEKKMGLQAVRDESFVQ